MLRLRLLYYYAKKLFFKSSALDNIEISLIKSELKWRKKKRRKK